MNWRLFSSRLFAFTSAALIAAAPTACLASITAWPFLNDGSDVISPTNPPATLPNPTDDPLDFAFLDNSGPPANNPSASTVAGWAGVASLVELYKQDAGEAEANLPFKDSYSFTYHPETSPGDDESGGLLKYDGAPDVIMAAASLFLLVKDGPHNPTNYLFNISSWDRMSTIELLGFWEGRNGGISHVTIYGINDDSREPPDDVVVEGVPEPATLAVWSALCLCGSTVAWRKRRCTIG